MRLKDKVVLVTGSGQGIGRGIAVRFAREGASVIVEDLHDDADSQQTLAMVREAGGDGCVPVDGGLLWDYTEQRLRSDEG